MGTALWGRGILRVHRDSAMGQEDQWAIGTALWGSAMGQGDPLIPWRQRYGAVLWVRGTLRAHRDSAMGQEDQWAIGTALWGSAMGQGFL